MKVENYSLSCDADVKVARAAGKGGIRSYLEGFPLLDFNSVCMGRWHSSPFKEGVAFFLEPYPSGHKVRSLGKKAMDNGILLLDMSTPAWDTDMGRAWYDYIFSAPQFKGVFVDEQPEDMSKLRVNLHANGNAVACAISCVRCIREKPDSCGLYYDLITVHGVDKDVAFFVSCAVMTQHKEGNYHLASSYVGHNKFELVVSPQGMGHVPNCLYSQLLDSATAQAIQTWRKVTVPEGNSFMDKGYKTTSGYMNPNRTVADPKMALTRSSPFFIDDIIKFCKSQ